jgi:hypothetical protein
VEFDITEKLTARAGAAYYQVTREEDRTTTEEIKINESWVEYEADGSTIVDRGPGEQETNWDASGDPYDPWREGCTLTTSEEITNDYTTYQLGLGYYFTENLQFDLMFAGGSGYVNSDVLFGSFTIIFP